MMKKMARNKLMTRDNCIIPKPTRFCLIFGFGLLLLSAALSATVQAQTWPQKTIKIIVPYTPGGLFDIHARLLADRLKALFGQPVVVENRPGAGTMIGADAVAKSTNDGYTLLLAGMNMFATVPFVYSNVPYKLSDFQTIALISDIPIALTVSTKQMPVADLSSFINYVKARPDQINFGSSGVGGMQHLFGELANLRLGLQMKNIGYRGAMEVLTALLGDQVPVAFDSMTVYRSNTGPDKPLKILAVSSDIRLELAPEVPTFAELGFPEMTVSARGGLLAPAGTPRAIIDKIHDAVVKANNDPIIRDAIVQAAAIPRTSTPEEFDAMIKSDIAIWRDIIQRLNIKVN